MSFTYFQESQDRNYILCSQHKKIPSYCLWEEYYVQKETTNQRKKWWNTIKLNSNSTNYNVSLNIISKWKIYYNQTSDT